MTRKRDKSKFVEPETVKAYAFRTYSDEEDRVGIDLADTKFGGRTTPVRVIRERDYRKLLKLARGKK